MNYRLVLAEKPSAAKAISAVLGATERKDGFYITPHGQGLVDGYIVSWCCGHLLKLAAPDIYDAHYKAWRYADLPIIPKTWLHVPIEDKLKQYRILESLMSRADVGSVINACDAGREGELIFRLVYENAKCSKPMKRLWISSMETEAIKAGFNSLKDGADYDNLYSAASCRECADWLLGFNTTRLFSVLYGIVLNTGRVQSPTLAMIAKRESDILAFVKEPFFTPLIDLGGFTASSEKHKTLKDAESVATLCKGGNAEITRVERVQKTTAPPKLYDLTSLQRDANRMLGYTAQQTLDYTQSLYERRYVSYPRTDSKYITADMRETILKLIGTLRFAPNIDSIIGTVSDHHAILPTIESRKSDLAELAGGEKELYDLIYNRLIAAVSPKHIYEAVTVKLSCAGHVFTANCKTIVSAGWKTQPNDARYDDTKSLPELTKGQVFKNVPSYVKEGTTMPPKHYTEDTLLRAMESAGTEDMPEDAERNGLGTPATRAGVIEKLITQGFIERSKKNLFITGLGRVLAAVLPVELTSAKLTAEWEHKLKQIERGELDRKTFLEEISAFTKSIVANNTAPKQELLIQLPSKKENLPEPLGSCPRCNSPVREGTRGFFCDSKSCGFKIWRESKFWTTKKKPLTAKIVAALLKNGRCKLKDLHSEKTGKKYIATVILNDTGGDFINFRLEF